MGPLWVRSIHCCREIFLLLVLSARAFRAVWSLGTNWDPSFTVTRNLHLKKKLLLQLKHLRTYGDQDIYHLGVTLADHSLDWNFCEVKAKSLQAPGPGCGNISSTFGTKSEITDFSLSEASETWHYCFLLKELEILSQSLFFLVTETQYVTALDVQVCENTYRPLYKLP